jgi:hypothetical protein
MGRAAQTVGRTEQRDARRTEAEFSAGLTSFGPPYGDGASQVQETTL